MKDILTKLEKEAIHEMAERAVTIQEGGKVGRWDRPARVILVYSVLCAMYRISKGKSREMVSTRTR